jgi:hypothetical protein
VKPSCQRRLRVVAAAVAIATGLLGCSYPSSGEHPALVVCGTTLQDAGGGPEVAPYFLRPTDRTITYIGGYQEPLYFQMTLGCSHGSHVTWLPRSAARLVRAAYASDGLAVALVLQPRGPRAKFRLIVTRDGRVVASVIIMPQPLQSPEIAATASISTS